MRTHAKRIAVAVFLTAGLAIIGAFLALPESIALGPNYTVAKTPYGKLKGYETEELIIWKGVPYAKPPVGELRWRPPPRSRAVGRGERCYLSCSKVHPAAHNYGVDPNG